MSSITCGTTRLGSSTAVSFSTTGSHTDTIYFAMGFIDTSRTGGWSTGDSSHTDRGSTGDIGRTPDRGRSTGSARFSPLSADSGSGYGSYGPIPRCTRCPFVPTNAVWCWSYIIDTNPYVIDILLLINIIPIVQLSCLNC